MISQKDAKELVEIIKTIDVKKLEIEHDDPKLVKWYRFGNFNALQVVCKIILDVAKAQDESSVS